MFRASDPYTTLWWADDPRVDGACEPGARPTGFASLDAELPGGGWPDSGLTELCTSVVGAEWWLLSPSLARSATQDSTFRPILCVAPPFEPYAPALLAMGLAPERLLKISPTSAPDAAWATEQGLKSVACAAVIWWVSDNIRFEAINNTLRRLQLAAKTCETPIFVLRPIEAQQQASAAALRLTFDITAPGQLAVTVFKRRGLPMAKPLLLSAPFTNPSLLRRWQALTPISTQSINARRQQSPSQATPQSSTDGVVGMHSLPLPPLPLPSKKGRRDDVVRMASARLAA